MKITADIVTAQSLLNDPKPDGLRIKSDSGSTKAINLNIDLNLTFDVAKVAAPIICTWIAARTIRKGANVSVNSKRLPPDDTAARQMIEEAVHNEQEKKQGGNSTAL